MGSFLLFFNGYLIATLCDEKNKKNTQYDYFHKSKVLVKFAPFKKQKLIPIFLHLRNA